MTGPTPKPEEPPDDDEDDLPIALPAKLPAAPTLSRFGPAVVDYQVNKALLDLIPKEAGNATLSVTLKSEGGDRIVKTVFAARGHGGWGAALGAALDLNDTSSWEVEAVGVLSWN